MKRIFFLLFFLTNLYSGLYDKEHIPYKIHLYTKDTNEHCGYKAYYAAKYKFVPDDWEDKFKDGRYFRDGTPYLAHYFKCPDGWEGYEVWIIDRQCENGKVWNFEKNECSCPDGLEWNGTKCIGLNDCPEGETLYNGKCVSPDDLLNSLLSAEQKDYYNNHCNIVYHQVSFSGDEEGMVCTANIYCDGEFSNSILVSCGQTSDTNSSIKEKCGEDEELIIIDGQVTCIDRDNFVSKFDNDNIDDGSDFSDMNNSNYDNSSDNNRDSVNYKHNRENNYSSHKSHDSDSKNDNSNNSNNSNVKDSHSNGNSDKVDCCSYFKSGHGTWTLVDGCLEYTIPETGQHCRIRDDGLRCYSCIKDENKDNNSNNSELSQISGILKNINNNSNNINDTLKSIIGMKPENNYDGDSKLNSTEESLFSGFSDTISNIKHSLDKLVDSFNKVKNLISNPKQFTLFDNKDIYTCPIVSKVYNNQVKIDICSFISPYRPILQLFFTLLFSFSVVFYFFDVILKGGNK